MYASPYIPQSTLFAPRKFMGLASIHVTAGDLSNAASDLKKNLNGQ